MSRWLSSLALALPTVLLATEAAAVRKPDTQVELDRVVRRVDHDPPAAAAARWQQFTAAHGSWQASWDADTGVPLRIWGEGVAAPGASADPAIAEAAARTMLAAQLALLAPGSTLAHWQLVSNVVHGRGGAMRTVGFAQRVDGLAVRGGAISFLFKRDRLFLIGSQALPSVTVRAPARVVTGAAATDAAVAWIAAIYRGQPTVLAEGDVAILPIVHADAPIEYRVVKTVTVDLAAPRGRWDVFVDAATGAPIARAQLLRFGAATLRYDVGVRNPSARQQLAAGFATITASATATTTDAAGGFSYPGTGATTVTATVVGPRVRVTSDGNPGATTTLTIGNGGVGVWANASELIDAQLSAFVHANLVKTFARTELDPALAWLDEQLEVRVNEIGSCNSYSTGDDIHFLLAGDGCENTGRVADLVYHEFGHSLHSHAIIPGAGSFDSAMSEGVSDYLAATMVDDSGVGRGHLVGSTAPLRELDPIGREAQWPGDLGEDAETTGLIIGGALWDMRKALIATRGATEGKRLADDLYYATLQRAADIPSTYAEILAADDDDGDLSNGTPNQCAIAAAFTPHGLVDPQLGLGVGIPTRDGFAVSVAVTAPPGGCAVPEVTGIDVEWRLRGGALQTVALTAAASTFTGSIPTQPADSVVEYRVVARLGNGTDITYPNNPGDPFYQFYVGPLAPLYCTDFEADPFANGWTHSATVGADDWQWGAPNGTTGNSDPTIAASGTRVVGTDLGIGVDRDGRYQRSAAETLVSPVIATTGRTGVRLQFKRWLSVEDGFYDDARILADGVIVWSNFAGPDQDSAIHTTDREWRFHDVELGAVGDDGSVQISFQLTSDQDLQLGGWTIDDFCVLASGTGPVPVCGNAQVETGEVCDDGNTTSGDGCSSACATEIVEPPDDGCCSTGGDPRGAIAIGLGSAILLLRRRRRA